MLIQCTKKLLNELKVKPAESEESPLFSWHANIIRINRRKTVVLVNDSNRYIIVLYGLKAKHFKNFSEVIKNAIRQTFNKENIKQDVTGEYLNYSPDVVYSKTKNRSYIGKLNKSCQVAQFYVDFLNDDTIYQSTVSFKASGHSVKFGEEDYRDPNKEFIKQLEDLTNKRPVISCKSAVLKVSLDLEDYSVWRKIIVPFNITFEELHRILQVTFDWQDYHLHDFHVYDGSGEPFVNIVGRNVDMDYEYDLPMIKDTKKTLPDYIPEYTEFKYTYDYGDYWQHSIEFVEIIENYSDNYPKCLLGEGTAPPEDVGGEDGYDGFLEAYEDPEHPGHENIVNWARMQYYKDFDINWVNRRLERVLRSRVI